MSKRRWLPLNALRAFEAVADTMSFTAGAQALGVTQSTTSRHVAILEALIGQKLLIRHPQGLELTPAGAVLLSSLRKSLDRIETIFNDLKESRIVTRVLKVHFPPSFLQQLALPLLADFRREFPEISLDVSSSFAPGAPVQDWDIAVVYDRPRVSDAIRDLLWNVSVTPVCARQVAADAKEKGLGGFLASQDLLHTRVPGQPTRHLWESFARRHNLTLNTARELTFDTMALAAQYAAEGSGVLLADVDMFSREIGEGGLTAPFPAEFEDGDGYYLQLAAEDLDDPVISTFRSWIIDRFVHFAAKRSRSPTAESALALGLVPVQK
jgi:DNA-binding transcriptional LysR family regulator